MRRTALALAVLVTLLAVAPAGGAQCDPGCGDEVAERAGDLGPDDNGVDDPRTGLSDPAIQEAGSTGPVLP